MRVRHWLAVLPLVAAGQGWCADTAETPDPLMDLFIQKGYVTQQEAAKVKAEADRMRTNELTNASLPAPGRSPGFKSIEIFGDVRLRYEDRSANDPTGGNIDYQRMRYAVRFGLRGGLPGDVYYGIRMETSQNPRSPFVTFGTSSSSSYPGPYGKSTATLAVGQFYIGWHPQDWVDVTLGKMGNPLYTTSLVWDSDLNPEGAAERFKYTVGDAEFFATFGQFIYQDVNPNAASGGLGINGLSGQNANNIFQIAWQGGFKYNFNTNTFAKVAATIYQYTGFQRSSVNSGPALSPYFGDPYVGEGAALIDPGNSSGYGGYGTSSTLPGYGSLGYPLNQVGLDNLLVLEFPFEFDFKVKHLDTRIFGDFAYNLHGSQRAQEAASAYSYVLSQSPNSTVKTSPFTPQTSDVKAYQIGFSVGSEHGRSSASGVFLKRHAWEFTTFWQHTEQYALDPNIIDSDIFEGRENMQGICVGLAYGITDNLVGSVRYAHASRINNQLGTGGSNADLPQMNPIDSYNLFQLDLGVKF